MVATVAAAAAIAQGSITWSGCEHRPRTRPAQIVVACGDGNFWVGKIRWSSWGARSAVGHGTAHLNDCKPNCAAGHFHTFAVQVTLSKVVECVKGRREFAKIEWGGGQAGDETLPCAFLRLKP